MPWEMIVFISTYKGFPSGTVVKNLPAMQETWIWSLGWYSCLANSMDREAWQATVQGVPKNWTWLSDLYTHRHTHTFLRKEFQAMVKMWGKFWKEWMNLCSHLKYVCFGFFFLITFLGKLLFLLSFLFTFTYVNPWLFCILLIWII